MGSYSELRLGSIHIGSDKNGINPLVMTLFRQSDKRLQRIRSDSPEAGAYIKASEWDPADQFDIVRYVATVQVVRDRLELMGFTLNTARAAFEAAAYAERQAHQAMFGDVQGQLPTDYVSTMSAALEMLTTDAWLDGLREIATKGLKPTYSSDVALSGYSPLLRFMLGGHVDGWYGFPGEDVRIAIRLALEAVPEAELEYDLTDLVVGGYHDTSDDLVAEAESILADELQISGKIVVLTEGTTDKWIIEKSLRLLFPHLADYFAFMDFEGANIEGGAGALASMVKAFIGAGISNRIVALFDNDTAASSALRSLRSVRLPPNVQVLQYDRLPLAERYPTIGPAGIATMDVNGLAGSVELYLGSDVLETDADFTPIHWRGFDAGMQQYQGEIMGKVKLHESFRRKLRDCEENPDRISAYDWSGVHLILSQLFGCFHEKDGQSLVASELNRNHA